MTWLCRFHRVSFVVTIERKFRPADEEPAIECRTQQYDYQERSSCDS